MRRGRADSVARTAALVALGSLALHQLRYLAGYGHEAGAELARQGHHYLDQGLPVLAALIGSGLVAGVLRAALEGTRDRPASSRARMRRRASLYALAILLVFCVQESIEGAMSAFHPGVFALLSAGGWTALPLAALIGSLCVLLDRGLVAIEEAIAVGPAFRPERFAVAPGMASPAPRQVPLAADPLAFGISRRPPPFPARSIT